MDRLTALSSFVRVCETGSFSAAARDLGISQPAVSQRIRELERRLGVRLFERTTRRVVPTAAGQRYLDHARAVLERLDEADHEVGSSNTALCGRLAVGAPVGFGTTLLAAYLVDFKRTHPGVFLDVTLADRFVDLVAEGLDVAIRMGTLTDTRLVVRRIGRIDRCLAAAPTYLDRRGRPGHPRDLAEHDYLLHAQIANGEILRLVDDAGTWVETAPRPVMRSDNSALVSEGILAGLGIGLVHTMLLDPLFADGRLERVLPGWRHEPHQVQAVYPSNRFVPLKVRAFVDGLALHFRKLGALEEG